MYSIVYNASILGVTKFIDLCGTFRWGKYWTLTHFLNPLIDLYPISIELTKRKIEDFSFFPFQTGREWRSSIIIMDGSNLISTLKSVGSDSGGGSDRPPDMLMIHMPLSMFIHFYYLSLCMDAIYSDLALFISHHDTLCVYFL